jgi:hypothetical protein
VRPPSVRSLSARRRSRAGAALIAVAALGLALSGVGVVAPPFLELEDARAERGAARRRADRARERDRERRLTLAQAPRLRGAAEVLDGLFPSGVEELDLYGAVRVAAEASDVTLESVEVSELRDPELPGLDESVAMREVALRGRGRLDGLGRLLRGLRGLGFPSAVLDVSTARELTDAPFDFSVTLGAYQLEPGWRLPSDGDEPWEDVTP